jgi:hypothetical protein
MTQSDSFLAAFGRPLAVALAWLGSWKLGEVQMLLGIVSGLVVTGYAATQWWVLWRDKIRRKE